MTARMLYFLTFHLHTGCVFWFCKVTSLIFHGHGYPHKIQMYPNISMSYKINSIFVGRYLVRRRGIPFVLAILMDVNEMWRNYARISSMIMSNKFVWSTHCVLCEM